MGLVYPAQGIVTDYIVFPTEKHDENAFYQILTHHMADLKKRNHLASEEIAGLGISVGSFIYHPEGSIDGMTSMVDFMTPSYPLKKNIATALGMPAEIDNDARLVGLAEALYGAGRDAHSVLTLTLGTGIGIAMTIDGKLWGPEARMHLGGHIRVREAAEAPVLDRRACYCATPGCLESTCAAPALEAFACNALGTSISCPDLFKAAEEGDSSAKDVLHWYLDMLVRGLDQYIYLYGPDVIVLAGGLAKGLTPFKTALQQRLKARIAEKRITELRLAELGDSAGILGGALLICGCAQP